MARNFWMVVCNAENFDITRDRGFTILGLKGEHRRKVQRVEAGDLILYYVSGIRRFTATALATSSYTEKTGDDIPIWKNEGRAGWPYRVSIKPEVVLDEPQYIDANILAPRLDYIRRWPPEDWYLAFQGNLHLLPKNDFAIIEQEMRKLKYGRNATPRSLSPTGALGSQRKRRHSPRTPKRL
jgi:hypothetical protein